MDAQEIKSGSDLMRVAGELHAAFGWMAWFRGERKSRSDWTLRPSVYRMECMEVEIATDFRSDAHGLLSSPPAHDDVCAWLTLMSHYRAPTRLLDWTKSILVAAFFATFEVDISTDAVIWALNPQELNKLELGQYGICSIRSSEVIGGVHEAFTRSRKETPGWNVAAVNPPLLDRRMIAQQAAFTIHRDMTALEDHSDAEKFLKKYTIPSGSRLGLRFELRLLGIRHGSVFPDLDGLGYELQFAYRRESNSVHPAGRISST